MSSAHERGLVWLVTRWDHLLKTEHCNDRTIRRYEGTQRLYLRCAREQLPDTVRHEGKRSILNFIATALPGCREDAIEHTLTSLLIFSKCGQATVIGRTERVDR